MSVNFTILLFFVFIDSARNTISSEIFFGDLFKGRSFVSTFKSEISGLKISSCGGFHPAADSSSAGWTRLAADFSLIY